LALGFARTAPLGGVIVGLPAVAAETGGVDEGDVGCEVAPEFVAGVGDAVVVELAAVVADGAVVVFAGAEAATLLEVVDVADRLTAAVVAGVAEFVVAFVAAALSTDSGVVTRGVTGAAARYLSQSALLPPASVYFFRAKVARVSPAGVPRVRFTERAR
jgi:hypothetical protein